MYQQAFLVGSGLEGALHSKRAFKSQASKLARALLPWTAGVAAIQ